MEMKVEQRERLSILDVEGEVDHFVAPKLQRQIDKLIDSGSDWLVLDFNKVDYLDSGGIGVLFNTMHQLVPRKGHIAIICKDQNLIRILELVGLFEKRTNISLFAERDKAIKALEGKVNIV